MNDRETHWHEQPVPAGLVHVLREIRDTQTHILQELRKMTQATEGLAAAIARLSGLVTTAVAEIQAQTAAMATAHANDDTDAVNAAAAQINTLSDNLTAAVNAATGAASAANAAAADTTGQAAQS